MSTRHAIAVAFDSRYYRLWKVFHRFLEGSWPAHPDIIALHTGLNQRQVEDLSRLTRAIRLPPDLDPPGIMYARFLLFGDAWPEYETILYLDVDILVLSPLDELFLQDRLFLVREAYAGADRVFRSHDDPALERLLRQDGLDPGLEAGNAGVLVIPRGCRTVEHRDQLRSLQARYRGYLAWGDQSVMNLWCARHGVSASGDFRFNFQVRLLLTGEERGAFRRMRLIHFNGQPHSLVTVVLMRSAVAALGRRRTGRRLVRAGYRALVRAYAAALKLRRLARAIERSRRG